MELRFKLKGMFMIFIIGLIIGLIVGVYLF